MQTALIASLNNKYPHRLNLLFAGWGMDPAPFQWLKKLECDTLLIYDYTSLEINLSVLESYDEYTLTAWSMGVWASEQVQLPSLIECIAINGTRIPVSDSQGIPSEIFEGTLHSLSEKSLLKFYRRMCGRDNYSSFLVERPHRTIEDLRQELEKIGTMSIHQNGNTPFPKNWTQVIIGMKDLIFPPENMRLHWQKEFLIEEKEMNHLFWNYIHEK